MLRILLPLVDAFVAQASYPLAAIDDRRYDLAERGGIVTNIERRALNQILHPIRFFRLCALAGVVGCSAQNSLVVNLMPNYADLEEVEPICPATEDEMGSPVYLNGTNVIRVWNGASVRWKKQFRRRELFSPVGFCLWDQTRTAKTNTI